MIIGRRGVGQVRRRSRQHAVRGLGRHRKDQAVAVDIAAR